MEDKKNDYTLKEEQIARFAKALGHPARVAILHFLAKREACYFGAIHEELPIAKATVSQHLKELKDAGLIQGEIETPKVKYWHMQAIVFLFQLLEGGLAVVREFLCGLREKEGDVLR